MYNSAGPEGFTFVELLVAIAILGILSALLFPALSSATAQGRRAICLSNVKQINQGVMLYAADNRDLLFPFVKNPDDPHHEEPNNPNWGLSAFEWTAYVPLVGRYVGWKGDPSPQDKLFACPADTFHDEIDSDRMGHWANQSLHLCSNVNFSSYFFNAGNAVFQGPVRLKLPNKFPGVLGSRLSSVRTPARTILLGEEPAWSPYSWHSPSRPRQFRFKNALDTLGFADGHVRYTRIYFDDRNDPSGAGESSFAFDPPAGFDYQWSGN